MKNVLTWFAQPFRFAVLERHLKRTGRNSSAALRVLDVGCGTTSPTLTCQEFPKCDYHSVDLIGPDEVLATHGLRVAANYRCVDLESEGLGAISGPFDLIVISHVFEHISNGLDVLRQAAKLLASGAYFSWNIRASQALTFPAWTAP